MEAFASFLEQNFLLRIFSCQLRWFVAQINGFPIIPLKFLGFPLSPSNKKTEFADLCEIYENYAKITAEIFRDLTTPGCHVPKIFYFIRGGIIWAREFPFNAPQPPNFVPKIPLNCNFQKTPNKLPIKN